MVEHLRQHDRAREYLSLVDEICQPLRMFLGLELVTGAVSFLFEQLQDPRAQPVQQTGVHAGVEDDVAVVVELTLFVQGHSILLIASTDRR